MIWDASDSFGSQIKGIETSVFVTAFAYCHFFFKKAFMFSNII